jgi:hypothetical protein
MKTGRDTRYLVALVNPAPRSARPGSPIGTSARPAIAKVQKSLLIRRIVSQSSA